MEFNLRLSYIVALFFFTLLAENALASSNVIEKFHSHLYAGQTAEAATVVNTRLVAVPEDDQARFALGAVQFLQAVEHLGQSLHRYGLRSGEYQVGSGLRELLGNLLGAGGLLNLPLLRIPVPENPNPKELTYEKFQDVLKTFVSNLQTTEATLDKIKDEQIALPLNIGLIRLDLNSDGIGSKNETLWQIFKVVGGAGWLKEDAARYLLTDFDFSDVAWLQGYCHLLMAIAEFPLAHDWSYAFAITFPSLFYMPSSPHQKFRQSYLKALAKLKEIPDMKFPELPKKPPGMTRFGWKRSPEYRELLERRRSELKEHDRVHTLRRPYKERIWWSGFADLIAFVHLTNWPVAEPVRILNILEHLEAMVRFSRENWKRIVAETDNGAEWIPNLDQTGVLPRMQVTKEMIDGWQQFLNEFEAILQGKKLVRIGELMRESIFAVYF